MWFSNFVRPRFELPPREPEKAFVPFIPPDFEDDRDDIDEEINNSNDDNDDVVIPQTLSKLEPYRYRSSSIPFIPPEFEDSNDITACSPEMPSNIQGTRGSRPVEEAVSVHSTVSTSSTNGTPFHADIHTFRTKTSHFDVDERGSCCIAALIKKNKFTSVCKKIKCWFKRAL